MTVRWRMCGDRGGRRRTELGGRSTLRAEQAATCDVSAPTRRARSCRVGAFVCVCCGRVCDTVSREGRACACCTPREATERDHVCCARATKGACGDWARARADPTRT